MAHPASERDVDLAARRLRAGGLVAFPTETVYGLGADARNPDAVRAVFRLKGRPATNPLIVHVAGVEQARALCAGWPASADRLAERFWPGPLTIVLPRSGAVPDEVAAGGPTVALRCPDHPVALALLRAFGGPLVGPSANPSGGVSPTTAEHVRRAFDERDALVLDGGPCRVGIESTVVSLAHTPPRVLRAGAISAQDIADALGCDVETDAEAVDSAGRALFSPGRFASHYAPAAPAELLDRADLLAELAREGGTRRVAALVFEPVDVESVDGVAEILMSADAQAYAQRLYAALHEADETRPERILIERPLGAGALWDAVRDRLRRACAPRG